jgi:hypothetical protein
MERYMMDVSAFPVVDKYERNVEMQWAEEASDRDDEESSELSGEDEDEDDDKEDEDKNEEYEDKNKEYEDKNEEYEDKNEQDGDENDEDEDKNDEDKDNDDPQEGSEEDEETPSQQKEKPKPKELDAHVHVDLSEQFRAALLALSIRSSQLAPLPPNCSFNISLELKDEPDIDPPVRHPQPWIPVQPSLQKTGRKATVRDEDDEKEVEEGRKEGQDLGGVKFTPIRSIEVGVFRFETWVEEGRAKFEGSSKTTSVASSVKKA